MWTIESRVGRLIELQIASPIGLAELEPLGQRLSELLRRQRQLGQRVVACTNLTGANLFAPEVAEWFIRLMYSDNQLLERSGFLIGTSAMFALQLERMLKQAASPLRRAFREPAVLLSWLGEVLSAQEHARLRQFLSEQGFPAI